MIPAHLLREVHSPTPGRPSSTAARQARPAARPVRPHQRTTMLTAMVRCCLWGLRVRGVVHAEAHLSPLSARPLCCPACCPACCLPVPASPPGSSAACRLIKQHRRVNHHPPAYLILTPLRAQMLFASLVAPLLAAFQPGRPVFRPTSLTPTASPAVLRQFRVPRLASSRAGAACTSPVPPLLTQACCRMHPTLRVCGRRDPRHGDPDGPRRRIGRRSDVVICPRARRRSDHTQDSHR